MLLKRGKITPLTEQNENLQEKLKYEEEENKKNTRELVTSHAQLVFTQEQLEKLKISLNETEDRISLLQREKFFMEEEKTNLLEQVKQLKEEFQKNKNTTIIS